MNFGTNGKPVCDFLLLTNNNGDPASHRLGDTATYMSKIADFCNPIQFNTPLAGMFPYDNMDDPYRA